jgi:hypothetical protein
VNAAGAPEVGQDDHRVRQETMMFSKIVVASVFAIMTTVSWAAADSYEGLWVRSAKDCTVDDVENSRTGIDFSERARSGGSLGLFDRYEHHCRIMGRAENGKRVTLHATCFEFWEDLENNRNSFRQIHRLEVGGPDRLIIDGKTYRRCTSTGPKP